LRGGKDFQIFWKCFQNKRKENPNIQEGRSKFKEGKSNLFVLVVELADGRKRSVRIAATDLVPPGNSSSAAEPSLPRISVRTLIPLARH
jgi:hypothetical protein